MINTGENKTGNSTKKNNDFGPKVGVFNARVAAINPSKEEISTLIGKDIDWPLEYVGKSQEGEDRIAMDIWLNQVDTNNYLRLRFSIVEKIRESKNNPGLFQWKNKQGSMVYGKSREEIEAKEGKIYEEFRKAPYLQAMVGEENLFDFLTVWLLQGKSPAADVEINPNMKAMFKGDFTELQALVEAHKDKLITGMATVSKGKDKSYQNVWKKFLPAWLGDKYAQGDRSGRIQRWVEEITGPYGCKDSYTLDPIHAMPQQTEQPAPTTPPAASGPVDSWTQMATDTGDLPF